MKYFVISWPVKNDTIFEYVWWKIFWICFHCFLQFGKHLLLQIRHEDNTIFNTLFFQLYSFLFQLMWQLIFPIDWSLVAVNFIPCKKYHDNCPVKSSVPSRMDLSLGSSPIKDWFYVNWNDSQKSSFSPI